ncbi:FHA domain-containing protein [Chloroflexus islandicus]|nr:FHA domain-containing protein [Chloroflexus islandicus]
MPSITIEIHYGPQLSKEGSIERSTKISELINDLITKLNRPMFNEKDQKICYGLFYQDGTRIPDDAPIGEKVRSGAIVYFSDVNNLWFLSPSPQLPGTAPLKRKPSRTDSEPPPPPPPPPTYGCRLHLAHGVIHAVSYDKVTIHRQFLLNHLPSGERIRQDVQYRMTGDAPIMHVSRDPHCEIVRQGNQWYVRALQPVYVNGKRYDHGATLAVQPPQMTVVVGRNGWPITIELFSP